MKIAIIGAFSDKLSTLHGLTSGLQELGHTWVPIESKPQQSPVNIKTPAFADYVAKQSQDCDTLLIGKGTTIPIHIYNLIIEKCHDTTFLTFDSVSGGGCGPPNRPLELGPRGLLCDRIILTGTEGARWFRENGYDRPIAQIFQGHRPSIWYPGDLPREEKDQISFLGNHYSGDGGRRGKIKALANAGFNIHYSRRCFHREASQLYWESSINLNLVCGDLISNRLWRILASGGFALTEDNADINHVFTDGKEVAICRQNDADHLIEVAQFYRNRRDLREEISYRGQEWSKGYTWVRQAEKMVKFVSGNSVEVDGAAKL